MRSLVDIALIDRDWDIELSIDLSLDTLSVSMNEDVIDLIEERNLDETVFRDKG